jgi:hypothetical protein
VCSAPAAGLGNAARVVIGMCALLLPATKVCRVHTGSAGDPSTGSVGLRDPTLQLAVLLWESLSLLAWLV